MKAKCVVQIHEMHGAIHGPIPYGVQIHQGLRGTFGAVSLLLRGALLRCFFVKAPRENEHQLNQHDLPESTSNKGHIICP